MVVTGDTNPALVRLGIIAVLLGVGVGWSHTPAALVAAGVLLAITLTAVAGKRHLGCFAVVPMLAWLNLPWPAPALLGVAAAALLGWRPTSMIVRPQLRWTASAAAVLVVSIAAVAPLANGRTSASPLLVHAHKPSLLILAALVLGAVLVNAAGEELLWRGVLYDKCTGSPVWFLIAAQAVSFGLSHAHGVPSGFTGILAATIFGAAVTVLRPRIGLLATIGVHACVDTVIFTIAAHHAIFVPH
jgi:membrane protease YdiL (CAAX protease family)